MQFITDDFLLKTKTAKILFHDYAEKMNIFDYHSHLNPKEIAEDKKYENLTQIWLYGDHYKWRAMGSNGINEKYITGDAGDYDKFKAWAQTVPYTMRNPLYHWTHLELARYFGIKDKLLNKENAEYIYKHCSEILQDKNSSVKNLIKKMKVSALCTTDDPVDDLSHHKKIKDDKFEIKVLPTFRPDKSMAVESQESFNHWVEKFEKVSNENINNFNSFLSTIKKRHDFFHATGCRISDHGLETVYFADFTENEIKEIFNKIRNRKELEVNEILKFKSKMMIEFAVMDYDAGWTQQLHLGAMRNNNTKYYKWLGPDTGFDSIGDIEIARPLSRFLDKLEIINKLPKTIIYNLNPKDNEVIATMLGNFQDGSIPGKIQFGSGWWFLDQKDGMEKQINALSNLGLLSRFVGMLTDSRSFLSYPRHEYFRRILCNLIGNDVENGELPSSEIKFLGEMVENICFNNANNYFNLN